MNQLKLMRYERGLTQQDVATGAGVTQATLSRLERGHGCPGAATAKALADFYGVPVAAVLGLATEREAA